jgi:hypothetical protein
MPLRTQATYLRERAARLREIAAIELSSPLYRQLIDMAEDMEERALDLEQEQATAEARAAVEKADPVALIGEWPKSARWGRGRFRSDDRNRQ